MRNSHFIFIAGLIFILLTDTIFWLQIKRYLKKRRALLLFGLHTLFFVSALVIFQLHISRLTDPDGYFWSGKFIGLLFLFYTPKLTYILFNGIGLLIRKCCRLLAKIIRQFALILSVFLFLVLLYSITLGRYNYKVESFQLYLENLPPAFDGFTIVQLSDIHLGSFGESYPGIRKLIEEVKKLQPDLIVFTGDMINNFASEMDPWIPAFQQLQAPYGKFAITGNHDYGHYTRWPDETSREQNLKQYFQNMETMGFHLLNNTRIPLVREKDTLWLAGVENWGNPPFPQYGKLSQAVDSLPDQACTVLLSHDPSHWRAEVWQYPQIALTLSGHTHAMQFGIKIGDKEWSPSSYLYPEYDGLYQHQKQYLHVNRGQGYIGYPGRIGLRPVITTLILHPSGK